MQHNPFAQDDPEIQNDNDFMNGAPEVNQPESDGELEFFFQQEKQRIKQELAQKKSGSMTSSRISVRTSVTVAETPEQFAELEGLKELQQILKTHDFCVLQVYTAWAPSPEELIATFPSQFPQVRFFKMDLDKHMGISLRYEVWKVPTFLFFRKQAFAGKVAFDGDEAQFLSEFQKLYDVVSSIKTATHLEEMHCELVDYIRSRHEEESKIPGLLEACKFLESREVYWPKTLEIIQEAATEGKPELGKVLKKLQKIVSPADQAIVGLMMLRAHINLKAADRKADKSPETPIVSTPLAAPAQVTATAPKNSTNPSPVELSPAERSELLTEVFCTFAADNPAVSDLLTEIWNLAGVLGHNDIAQAVNDPGMRLKINRIPALAEAVHSVFG